MDRSNIKTSADLRQAIATLETQQKETLEAMRLQAQLAYQSLEPVNILKMLFRHTSTSSVLNNNFVRTSLGILIGQFSKTLFIGTSKGWFRKYTGTLLSTGITNVIARNPAILNAVGTWLESFGRQAANEGAGTMAQDEEPNVHHE